MNEKRALIAMSGGVDSSVAACLMKRSGYQCIGATMRLFDNSILEDGQESTCCSLDDVEYARSVAYRLNIPHYVFNFTDDFRERVMDKFVRCYECGATPNPCIDCNRYLKFEHLLRRGLELGCDYVVTGHYAQIRQDAATGRYLLYKAADLAKDQTYFLYSLTQEQLAHTCFPLGELTKEQVRQIAQEENFINAKSMTVRTFVSYRMGIIGHFWSATPENLTPTVISWIAAVRLWADIMALSAILWANGKVWVWPWANRSTSVAKIWKKIQ